MAREFLTGDNAALFTDFYELTMAQAYRAEGMTETATFSLFVRRLPATRNYLLACGLEQVLSFLETWAFSDEDLSYLRSQSGLSEEFIESLRDFEFTGDVYALPEGTPFFPEEPIVEVVAPIAQAQLLETYVMNQVHTQSLLATKAARIVTAAQGRAVLDFGARRIHGTDGAVLAARAFHVGGLTATSNVLAGKLYGVPVAGTMAHSYIEAHEDEHEAFATFAREFPATILLVDTYDTLVGVRKVVALARELGARFRVRGIRLDSGNLAELARQSRDLLDEAGLDGVQIFLSGGLDEYEVGRYVEDGVPFDGVGVGTALGVSDDAPALDIAYKLSSYAGLGRLKLSAGKRTLPGRKQVFRQREGEGIVRDVLGRADEDLPGEPLLRKVMEGGRRTDAGREDLSAARDRARRSIDSLPDRVRDIDAASPPFEVQLSASLEQYHLETRRRVEQRQSRD